MWRLLRCPKSEMGEWREVPERDFKNAERSRDVKSERAAEIQIGKMVGGHCLPV